MSDGSDLDPQRAIRANNEPDIPGELPLFFSILASKAAD
jgi:hypothetical protein